MAIIQEINGNIFNSKCQTIVNTVNCFGIMGKGIAFEFKNRFPEMYIEYKEICDKRLLKPGKLHFYKKSEPWILNFPTKYHWRNHSKLEYIESGLQEFSRIYAQKNISSIAFPELGTISGKLDWGIVKPFMYKYLEPLKNLDIELYHFNSLTEDQYFNLIKSYINDFEIEDCKKYLKLNKKQAATLKNIFKDNKVKSMYGLQNIKGLGRKSIQKIYIFANKVNKNKNLKENIYKQMSLFKNNN